MGGADQEETAATRIGGEGRRWWGLAALAGRGNT